MGFKGFAFLITAIIILSACGERTKATTTNNNVNNNSTIPIPTAPPTTAPTPTPVPTPTPTPVPGTPAGPAPQVVAARYAYDTGNARYNNEFCSQVGNYPGVPTTVVNTAYLSQPVTGTCQQIVLTKATLGTFANNLSTCTQKVSAGSCRSTDAMEQQSVLFIAKSANGCSRSIGVDSTGVVKGRRCNASGCTEKRVGTYTVAYILSIYVDLIKNEIQQHSVGPGSVTCSAIPNDYQSVTMAGGLLSIKQVASPCGDTAGGAPGTNMLAMANFSEEFFNIFASQIACQ